MLIKTPLLHQSFGPVSFFLSFHSFSLTLWATKFWSIKGPTSAISLFLLLSYRRLQTTRFRSIKGSTLQGIFPTQGSNVLDPGTRISCLAGGFFTTEPPGPIYHIGSCINLDKAMPYSGGGRRRN